MRRALAALVAAVLLAACAGKTNGGADPNLPASFVVTPGEEFDVRLESNPSTGYQWHIGEPLDEQIVKLVGSDFQRAAAAPESSAASKSTTGEPVVERMGQSGIETWRFRAVAPGRTRIELVYGRPWEDDKVPARFAVYSVEVR